MTKNKMSKMSLFYYGVNGDRNYSGRIILYQQNNSDSSGNKRYTFEASCQVLTSIDTKRLTPCCSLLFVYNFILLIVECLKWGMHVR